MLVGLGGWTREGRISELPCVAASAHCWMPTNCKVGKSGLRGESRGRPASDNLGDAVKPADDGITLTVSRN